MNSRATNRRSLVLSLVILIGSGMLVVGLYFFFLAASSGSKKPDVDAGKVYEVNNHGSVTYVTRTESLRMDALIWGGLVDQWPWSFPAHQAVSEPPTPKSRRVSDSVCGS